MIAASMAFDTLAVTEYGDFNFNSMCLGENGIPLGFSESGLFVLDKPTSVSYPVNSEVIFPMTDFGSHHLKRIRYVNIAGVFGGNILVEVSHKTATASKTVTVTSINQYSFFKVMVPRIAPSPKLAVRIASVSGATMAINTVTLHLVVVNRVDRS